MKPSRQLGATLVFVVLLMLALLGLAHGVLVASLSEVAASRAAVRDVVLRGASDWALSRTMRVAPMAWADSLGPWGERSVFLGGVGTAQTEGILRRLGRESWLAEGRARGPEGVTSRSRRLAWSLDPLARVTALAAAVTVGPAAPVILAGSVDAGAPAAPTPPMTAAACEPWSADLAQWFAATPLTALHTSTDSVPPALGLLDFESLLAAAPVVVSGSGTPAPAEALGVCLEEDPWVWGDPDQPWRPCGTYLVFGASDGDVTVDGGAGQGILVVDGNVTLESGARFYGMVVTSGYLRLTSSSRLEGMALAAGGLEVGSGSVLHASACWAVRALDGHRSSLGRLLPVSAALGDG